jgi:hypothetical protein
MICIDSKVIVGNELPDRIREACDADRRHIDLNTLVFSNFYTLEDALNYNAELQYRRGLALGWDSV